MHVHAHPDDESSKGAASTAKYVAEGVDVHVVTCTGGERGLDPQPQHGPPRRARQHHRDPPPGDGAGARDPRRHARTGSASSTPAGPRATRKPPLPEGCFGLVSPEEGAAPLVRLIRDVQAARAHDVRRERRLSRIPTTSCATVISMQAWETAGDPDAYPEHGRALAAAQALLPPHLPPRPDRGDPRGDARARTGVPVRRAARGVEAATPSTSARVTTRVPVRRVLPRTRSGSDRARHPDRPRGAWFAVPLEVHQDAWPTEDYELVESLVPTDIPEDDLFAGIRDLAATVRRPTRDDRGMTAAVLLRLRPRTTSSRAGSRSADRRCALAWRPFCCGAA